MELKLALICSRGFHCSFPAHNSPFALPAVPEESEMPKQFQESEPTSLQTHGAHTPSLAANPEQSDLLGFIASPLAG